MKRANKYFTKSVFKEALICPMRLNYCNREEYANQDLSDDFLDALAEGGFQVGELAKIYYQVAPENDLTGSADDVAQRTKELLAAESVTIAEAGFIYGRCFCRVDILRKNGDEIEIIEVKSRSWDSTENAFTTTKGEVKSDVREYVYDVAFQKYVVSQALKELFPTKNLKVKAALMMADKLKVADRPGINQYFKIERQNDRTQIKRMPGAEKLKDGTHLLTPFWEVDQICDAIIAGRTPEQEEMMGGRHFVPFIDEMAARYCEQKQVFSDIKLGTKCFKCPYHTSTEDVQKRDGYDECWRAATAGSDDPYVEYTARPLLETLWGGDGGTIKEKILDSGRWFLDQITLDDLLPKKITPRKKSGMPPYLRRWVQVALTTNHPEKVLDSEHLHDGIYLDIPSLKAEMAQWEFPLHMIDFETSAVALPFYEKMSPYENVAFQFSHHIIESKDGGKTYQIRHAGQWINEGTDFPNFEFVRQLKRSVGDKGSIFRYSNHENTILQHIRKQLLDRNDQADTTELVSFIDSISHSMEKGKKKEYPKRDMIDLWDMVKRFYYDPLMKGSNSIKAVLPAVLTRSTLLREKYARPIYGSEIPSKNFTSDDPKVWIVEQDGEVLNPYKLLESVSSYYSKEAQKIEDNEYDTSDDGYTHVNNGGSALWAYGSLQFCQQTPEKKKAFIQALLRYCELDTLAMVFIWEFFNEMVNR